MMERKQMNGHILTNYGIIRSFHNEGKSIITALLPLVEYGIAKVNEDGKDYYDKESLDARVYEDCGVKIPLLTLTTLLKKLEKDKKIELFDNNRFFRIVNIGKIDSKHYLDGVKSTDRRINKFIEQFRRFSSNTRSDAEIKEEIFSFIQISRNRQIGVNDSNDKRLNNKFKQLYKFIEEIYKKEDELVKIYQDISFGYTLCSVLEKEGDLESIKLKDFTIYLDSNFILRLLDLQEECFSKETKELFELLKKSGAKLIVFEETITEVINVIEYYKTKYQNEKKTISNIYEASRINGVFGAFFRRNLSITQIDNIIDNVENEIVALGISRDNIKRFNIKVNQDEIKNLYIKKYGEELFEENSYRYNKCSNYISIIKIIKWQREKHNVRARCFGNSKYIFLTCDWKLYRYSLSAKKSPASYSEIIIQEAVVDNLMLFFPENYSELSTELIISVYQSSQYLNVHDLEKLGSNIESIIKEGSTLSSYVISASRNIDNYAEISQLYSDGGEDTLDGFKKIVEAQMEKDANEKAKYEATTELAISKSFEKGKELGKQEERQERIKAEAAKYAKKAKVGKICLILFLIFAPIVIAILMVTNVINLDNLALGDNTKWVVSPLLAISSWAASVLLGKFFKIDEQYFYKKLLKKYGLKDNTNL